LTIDAGRYKDFFANWPGAVAVITCRGADGAPQGFTASSFISLSLDPTLVLFAIKRSARSLPHFAAAEGFAVNALKAEQGELSTRFATPQPDKFAGLEYTEGAHTGAPLLKDAWGRLECRTVHQYDGGDHVIFVGEVLSLDMEEADPLVYHRRRYRRLVD